MIDTQDLSPLEALLLTRYLVAGAKPPTAVAIKKDVGSLVEDRWTGSALTAMLERAELKLLTLGYLSRPEPATPPAPKKKGKTPTKPKLMPVELTPAGREAGMRFLGVSELPPKSTWASVKKTLLSAKALGLAGKAAVSKDGVKARLLAKALGIAAAEGATAKEVLDAWTRKQFGLGPKDSLSIASIQQALACRELGEHRPSDPKKAFDLLVARQVGARKADDAEIGNAILRRWAGGPVEPEPRIIHQPGDLSAFAARVKDAAARSKIGRFGDNRVFIAHVWDALQDDPEIRALGLEAFKQRLTEANNKGLLELGRADLSFAMDQDDVRRSEAGYMNATFHFIKTGTERP